VTNLTKTSLKANIEMYIGF